MREMDAYRYTLILRFLSLLSDRKFPDISSWELFEKSLRHRGFYRRVALEMAKNEKIPC